jgi:hypothetical protein
MGSRAKSAVQLEPRTAGDKLGVAPRNGGVANFAENVVDWPLFARGKEVTLMERRRNSSQQLKSGGQPSGAIKPR